MFETNTADRDYVLKSVHERDIHFIRLWFTDVLGQMKSFAITPNELELAFDEGMGFDGSSIEGFARETESDMLAVPDASTFQVLPWRPSQDGVARMFCSIYKPSGQPFDGDPRFVLRKMLKKAADLGYEFNVGPEVEYFYFKDNKHPQPIDQGGYFDLTPLDSGSDLRRDTILTLEKMGIPVEYSHHEIAPSQQEIDLRFSDALSMADAVMTYRLVVKEVAAKHGVYASFMPKPIAGIPGSGMHVHQSLFEDDKNAFYDKDDPLGYSLSKVAKSYLAGLLRYAAEMSLITNQYVNSYKRLVAGFEAPTHINWGGHDRSALIRVPSYKPDKQSSARFELRSPDCACNPYLVFAACLGAGLKGIEEGLELPPSCDNAALAAKDTDKVGEHHNIGEHHAELLGEHLEGDHSQEKPLPKNLGQAIELFENSQLMVNVLGKDMHRYIVANKREEWEKYCEQVTKWELEALYPKL